MSWPRFVAALGAAVLTAGALTGCGFAGLYSVALPGGADVGNHPMELTVEFVDVLDLVPQAAVKVNDVAVGRVEKVELTKPGGWTATVTVLVNGDVALPANARAEISQTSLLGEKYVSLQQPDDAAPQGRLADHSNIPITRTGSNTEVEQVLGALSLLLNGGGLPQIATITTELNKALGGRTADVRSLLDQLTTLTKTLDDQKNTITDAITRVNNLAATLDAQKQVLVNTLDTLPGALTVLADERDQLVALLSGLDQLSGKAVGVINASTANLNTALVTLQPTLEQLTAAGDNLANGFELLGTYPFPKTATRAIGGDYTNLIVTLDGNLGDLLGNLLNSTCAPDAQADCAFTSPLPVGGLLAQSASSSQLPLVPGAAGAGG